MIRLRYDSVLQRCFHVKNVSPLRKFVSPSTSCVVDHVRKCPSAFRSGGSKVIRRLLRGRREKPGDEATSSNVVPICGTTCPLSHAMDLADLPTPEPALKTPIPPRTAPVPPSIAAAPIRSPNTIVSQCPLFPSRCVRSDVLYTECGSSRDHIPLVYTYVRYVYLASAGRLTNSELSGNGERSCSTPHSCYCQMSLQLSTSFACSRERSRNWVCSSWF